MLVFIHTYDGVTSTAMDVARRVHAALAKSLGWPWDHDMVQEGHAIKASDAEVLLNSFIFRRGVMGGGTMWEEVLGGPQPRSRQLELVMSGAEMPGDYESNSSGMTHFYVYEYDMCDDDKRQQKRMLQRQRLTAPSQGRLAVGHEGGVFRSGLTLNELLKLENAGSEAVTPISFLPLFRYIWGSQVLYVSILCQIGRVVVAREVLATMLTHMSLRQIFSLDGLSPTQGSLMTLGEGCLSDENTAPEILIEMNEMLDPLRIDCLRILADAVQIAWKLETQSGDLCSAMRANALLLSHQSPLRSVQTLDRMATSYLMSSYDALYRSNSFAGLMCGGNPSTKLALALVTVGRGFDGSKMLAQQCGVVMPAVSEVLYLTRDSELDALIDTALFGTDLSRYAFWDSSVGTDAADGRELLLASGRARNMLPMLLPSLMFALLRLRATTVSMVPLALDAIISASVARMPLTAANHSHLIQPDAAAAFLTTADSHLVDANSGLLNVIDVQCRCMCVGHAVRGSMAHLVKLPQIMLNFLSVVSKDLRASVRLRAPAFTTMLVEMFQRCAVRSLMATSLGQALAIVAYLTYSLGGEGVIKKCTVPLPMYVTSMAPLRLAGLLQKLVVEDHVGMTGQQGVKRSVDCIVRQMWRDAKSPLVTTESLLMCHYLRACGGEVAVHILTRLGHVYLTMGRIGRAVMVLERALVLQPHHIGAIILLSVVHAVNGDMASSNALLDTAVTHLVGDHALFSVMRVVLLLSTDADYSILIHALLRAFIAVSRAVPDTELFGIVDCIHDPGVGAFVRWLRKCMQKDDICLVDDVSDTPSTGGLGDTQGMGGTAASGVRGIINDGGDGGSGIVMTAAGSVWKPTKVRLGQGLAFMGGGQAQADNSTRQGRDRGSSRKRKGKRTGGDRRSRRRVTGQSRGGAGDAARDTSMGALQNSSILAGNVVDQNKCSQQEGASLQSSMGDSAPTFSAQWHDAGSSPQKLSKRAVLQARRLEMREQELSFVRGLQVADGRKEVAPRVQEAESSSSAVAIGGGGAAAAALGVPRVEGAAHRRLVRRGMRKLRQRDGVWQSRHLKRRTGDGNVLPPGGSGRSAVGGGVGVTRRSMYARERSNVSGWDHGHGGSGEGGINGSAPRQHSGLPVGCHPVGGTLSKLLGVSQLDVVVKQELTKLNGVVDVYPTLSTFLTEITTAALDAHGSSAEHELRPGGVIMTEEEHDQILEACDDVVDALGVCDDGNPPAIARRLLLGAYHRSLSEKSWNRCLAVVPSRGYLASAQVRAACKSVRQDFWSLGSECLGIGTFTPHDWVHRMTAAPRPTAGGSGDNGEGCRPMGGHMARRAKRPEHQTEHEAYHDAFEFVPMLQGSRPCSDGVQAWMLCGLCWRIAAAIFERGALVELALLAQYLSMHACGAQFVEKMAELARLLDVHASVLMSGEPGTMGATHGVPTDAKVHMDAQGSTAHETKSGKLHASKLKKKLQLAGKSGRGGRMAQRSQIVDPMTTTGVGSDNSGSFVPSQNGSTAVHVSDANGFAGRANHVNGSAGGSSHIKSGRKWWKLWPGKSAKAATRMKKIVDREMDQVDSGTVGSGGGGSAIGEQRQVERNMGAHGMILGANGVDRGIGGSVNATGGERGTEKGSAKGDVTLEGDSSTAVASGAGECRVHALLEDDAKAVTVLRLSASYSLLASSMVPNCSVVNKVRAVLLLSRVYRLRAAQGIGNGGWVLPLGPSQYDGVKGESVDAGADRMIVLDLLSSARMHLERAIDRDPLDGETWSCLCHVYKLLGVSWDTCEQLQYARDHLGLSPALHALYRALPFVVDL